MAITKDHAWLSTFREVGNTQIVSFLHVLKNPPLIHLQNEGMVSDPEQLLERVLASHDVRIEDGQYSNTYSLFFFL